VKPGEEDEADEEEVPTNQVSLEDSEGDEANGLAISFTEEEDSDSD